MIDPVCGMTVEPRTAAAAWDHEGTTYYFCSVGCLDRFRTDPDRWIGSDPSERRM
jgi:Cu+-exporting ATPase